MPDFSKGKIYKITNDYNDDIYIGSTCDTLVKRFSRHRLDAPREDTKNRPLYKLMNEIGFERFRIQLLEDYPCEDLYQLHQREGYYIRTMGTLNLLIAGRNDQQYRQENKAKIAERDKKFREANKEKIKMYEESRREQRKEYNKHWREDNKEHIKEYEDSVKEYRRENITCECGSILQRCKISRHIKTAKHNQLMQAKQAAASN